jgi:hypothetical protein
MKIMNVSLTIDVQNPQQVHALKQLMDALATNETPNAIAAAPAPTPVVEKAKRTRQPKPVVEEDMPQAPSPEPQISTATPKEAINSILANTADKYEDDLMGEDEAVTIDLATLRSKTAEKSILNRAEIKAKLAEYGAANVTSIPEEYYADYYTFITSL